MENVQFDVPGISCGHCVKTIDQVVGELAGVRAVRADLDTKRVEVTYDAPATREQIAATMTEWGYPPSA
jgi:copper ion binding protein